MGERDRWDPFGWLSGGGGEVSHFFGNLEWRALCGWDGMGWDRMGVA